MSLVEEEVRQIVVFLSVERLRTLTELTNSASMAVSLHQETLSLGASLMNVTGTVEIALRNAICENLGRHFGVSNWLIQPPVSFQWRGNERDKVTKALDSARRAKYSKLSQQEKGNLDQLAYPNGRPSGISHLRRAKDRRKQIAVTDGSVVSELTFYFWKRLFGPEYNQTLWRTTLKRMFPDRSITRAAVAIKLEKIYQSRNRLAHHEPVLHNRFDDTIAAIQFVADNLRVANGTQDSALGKLIADDLVSVQSRADALHTKLNSYRARKD